MINRSKLVSIIFSGIILFNLSGCKKQEKIVTQNVQNNISKNDTEININSANVEELTDEGTQEEIISSNTQDVMNEVNQNMSKDEIIVNYFNMVVSDINNFVNSENIENAKGKCKEYFLTFVDFIFYDGKIKNITFSELKETTQKQVISIVQKVDSLIMKKFPDYKEDIASISGDLYNKASELLNSSKENLEDYVISKIGEEKYEIALDRIEEIKENDKETWNNIKNFGNEVYDNGKENLKSWYENFKSN